MADSNSITKTDNETFADRLIVALTFQGITDRKAQIAKLAELSHITLATASKYLQAETAPKSARIFDDIVSGLDCDWRWLYEGVGYSPWQLAVVRNMANMSDWQKNKFLRLCIRLRNGDAKALKNLQLFNRGFINQDQFLSAM